MTTNIIYSLFLFGSLKVSKTSECSMTEPHTLFPLFLEMYLPLASAPPSWSHLCEQAERAQPLGPVCSAHERLLPGNLKTLGDWGCLAARRAGRVKRRGGEFEVEKGCIHLRLSSFSLFMLLPWHSVLSHSECFYYYFFIQMEVSEDEGCLMLLCRL